MEKILSIVLSFIIGFVSYPLSFIPSLNDTEFSASEDFLMDIKSYSPIEYDYYFFGRQHNGNQNSIFNIEIRSVHIESKRIDSRKACEIKCQT